MIFSNVARWDVIRLPVELIAERAEEESWVVDCAVTWPPVLRFVRNYTIHSTPRWAVVNSGQGG